MNNLLVTNKIQGLNDLLRTTGQGERCMVTRGVHELGPTAVSEIRQNVATYSSFTNDNDPYGEHDFGALTFNGQKLFWKIDYYDRSLAFGSPNASDPTVTMRVLTIMLASEY